VTQTTLRVIAGELKGRRLAGPSWEGLRPTSDRLRETIFNVLAPLVPGARVLDAYAGTGAVGIEALSRGAAHVTFAERDPRAVRLIEDNLARCGVLDRYTVLRTDVARGELSGSFDIVFLDPPYTIDAGEASAAVAGLVAPDGRLVVEHARRTEAPESVGPLTRARTLHSGDSTLTIYRTRERVNP
jgi:16S rRNA (guanine(966)-N(2))-methyltransferase RsmD